MYIYIYIHIHIYIYIYTFLPGGLGTSPALARSLCSLAPCGQCFDHLYREIPCKGKSIV